MREIPILFCGEMVRAIMAGKKTMTRRIRFNGDAGDILWVRETWAMHPDGDGILYRATDPGWDDEDTGLKWRPSIFMPRKYSRISMRVASISTMMLCHISPNDARSEGFESTSDFIKTWDSLNAKRGYGWDKNPYVHVISFRRI